ncbi:ABC transporter ATP-binding protein [Streptomyces sp. H10-C2]|uniref:ABC transporter ATP-binding protein n=1 Tax=unclassified Streptomyces TaxID=2593676 RepID=UPI0024BB60F6|nr:MULTISPECIES: ABC transporter ATP-binding protein [unclassified Streptomyces]MDJ0343626.1 ABC transporter ATP-binding protein [Streptomyces sp. PH10-H1]MDJ0373126.1 ABC transporter ATP-binding protein [Streptomyces sp. H10-C2]
MRRLFQRPRPVEPAVSDSERLLFGGALRYDMGWSKHEYAVLEQSGLSMARTAPRLVGGTVRLAWRADRSALLTMVLSEIFQGVAHAVALLATNAVLKSLFGGGDTVARVHAALPAMVVATLIAMTSAVLASLSTASTGRLEPKVERLATEEYLRHAERVELEAVEDGAFRKLLDSAQFGAQSSRRMISATVASLNGVFSLTAAASVLSVLHPVLLPLLLLIAAPRGWGALQVAQRRYASAMAWIEHERAARVISLSITGRSGAQETRVHGVGKFLLRHFGQMAETAEAEQTRLAKERAGTELLAAALSGAAALLAYTVLGWLLLSGRMSMAVAGTAVLAVRTGSANLGTLVGSVNRLHEESLYVRDLDRYNLEAAARAIPTGGLTVPEHPARIDFEHVTYCYPDRDQPALDDITLTIPAGTVVALVGENGSGKSTLVKLLAGLHMPQAGRIQWDGVDLRQANRDQVFARVALLDQAFEKWPFTAETNLAIGKPEQPADPERLAAAAAFSGADAVIEGLPHGMQTLLALQFRGGSELSGGQWQKIGLSRTRYRDASVIIVDEPTSALDPEAEIACFEKIRHLRSPATSVVLVTHRMAAVQHADLIYVLHDGRLVEQGTHQELLAIEGGRYYRMFQSQADQYIPANGPVPRQTAAPGA